MHPDTYVIVPVWNEGAIVGDVVKNIRSRFEHVVCVDDGSRDNSGAVLATSGAHVITHPFNLGAGAAMQTGIDYALGDKDAKFFVTIDADGQHDIHDAELMLDHLRKQNLDVVIGSRFLGITVNMPVSKRWLLPIARLFSSRTDGVRLSDPHNGLLVCTRHFAEHLQLTLADFSHKSEIVQRIAEHDFRYDEFPVTVRYTAHSKANGQPLLNAVNIVFDLLIKRVVKP